jgi:DNA-binding beta-propeller fold protein YncE
MPLFHQGDGVGVDRQNTVYVWDSLESRVRKFSPSGKLLTWWHVAQATPGSPWAPNHLAVDPQGNSSVLAVPGGISRYSPSGKLLRHWAAASNSVAVAAGGSGNVFVLSREGTVQPNSPQPAGGNARVDKYSPQGLLLSTWRTPTIVAKDVEPDGIAVDSRGNVYVTVGTDNSCYKVCLPMTSVMYRFDPTGAITFTYIPGRKTFGPISAVDRQGSLYLLQHDFAFDSMNILKLSPAGTKLAQWPGFGGILKQALLLQVDGNGRMIATSSEVRGLAPWQRSAVVRILSPAGKQLAQFGQILVQKIYDMSLGLTVNKSGTLLYLTSGPGNGIYRVLNITGKALLQVNNPKGPQPIVSNARAIAVDGAGNVYIDDSTAGRIVKFSPSGKHLATFPLPEGYRAGSDGMALDRQSNMYVVCNSHVLKLSPQGALLANFGGPGTGLGQFAGPGDVIVDASGNLYVADTFNHRIQKLSPTGRPLLMWGDVSIFDRPIRLAIDPTTGHVWVADLTHAYLQEFTTSGTLVARRGQYGVFPGQLSEPVSLAFEKLGNLYVLDYGNNRIQERYKS